MKDAASDGMATAAFANAQIHALSASEPHYAGKYCYERKRNEREIHYRRLRMNDFARHMNTLCIFKGGSPVI